MQKKTITVCVPVYNEGENVRRAYGRITAVMQGLTAYDYELVFFDDGSTDGSRRVIEELCQRDPRVKAVLFTRNFGYSKTVFHCMQQARGNAAVLVHCDLQNPPEQIPLMVEKWEAGADAVLGVKKKSRENGFLFFLRTLCYWAANALFGMKLIPHATDFELLDRSLLNVLRQVRGGRPFLRGLVKRYAANPVTFNYVQDRRAAGRSHFSPGKYYEFAVEGMVDSSRCIPRRLLCFSLLGMLLWLAELLFRFVPGATDIAANALWDGLLLRFGTFLLLLGLLALSLLFEYVIAAADNAVQAPTVTEAKRLNLENEKDDERAPGPHVIPDA